MVVCRHPTLALLVIAACARSGFTLPSTPASTGEDTGAQDPGLTVTSVSPIEGPVQGGTPLEITGTDFTDGLTIVLGDVDCTAVVVHAVDRATCTTPPHAAETLD